MSEHFVVYNNTGAIGEDESEWIEGTVKTTGEPYIEMPTKLFYTGTHKGVDYAAPQGTPVRAAGDGKVIFAGRKGGYGRTLVLQHGSTYSTLYAHLNGFARKIKKAVRRSETHPDGGIIEEDGPIHISNVKKLGCPDAVGPGPRLSAINPR